MREQAQTTHFKSGLSHFLVGYPGAALCFSVSRRTVPLGQPVRFRCILGGTLSSRTCRLSPLNRWLRSSSSHHKSCGAFLENHSRARLGQWWSLDPTSAYLLLCVVHKQRVVLIFKLVWQDKRIVVIIHDMWKSYDIYILAPINKVLLRHGQPHSFSDPVRLLPCANSIVQQLKQKSKGCKDIYSLAFERKLLPILALQIGLERLKNTRRKTG